MLTNSIIDDIRYYIFNGNVIVKLILANVIIYFIGVILWVGFTAGHHEEILQTIDQSIAFPANPAVYIKQPWSLFTYAFYHNRFLHVLFNMIMLYWAGELFILYLPEDRAVPLYVFGGVIGAIFYVIALTLLPGFHNSSAFLIGASASALAFLFAAVAINPDHEVYVFRNGPFKLKYIAGILFAIYFIAAYYEKGNGGANVAHIGGAIAGFSYIKLRHWGIDVFTPFTAIANLFTRKPNVRVTHKNEGFKSVPRQAMNDDDQKKVDGILDKISRSGYDSLTKEEKDFLFNYSKK